MILLSGCGSVQYTNLIVKLASGDMVALEAKYHTKCLANLYNRARAATDSTSTDAGGEANLNSIVFAELMFIEDTHKEEGIILLLSCLDLARLYKARLEKLRFSVDSRIHTSRLKSRLLAVIPDLQSHP